MVVVSRLWLRFDGSCVCDAAARFEERLRGKKEVLPQQKRFLRPHGQSTQLQQKREQFLSEPIPLLPRISPPTASMRGAGMLAEPRRQPWNHACRSESTRMHKQKSSLTLGQPHKQTSPVESFCVSLATMTAIGTRNR